MAASVLNGYNLLGLLDEDLNKRLYLLNVGNRPPGSGGLRADLALA